MNQTTTENLNNFSKTIQQIISFTKDNSVKAPILKVLEKYSEIKEKYKNDFLLNVMEDLKWVAESRRDASAVKKASELLMSDSVINLCTKYTGDIANEIFESLYWCIEASLDEHIVKKYALWMNNGHIGKLLDFANELNGNGNVKMKRDILSILYVKWSETDQFDTYATKINNKKLILEKKVQMLSILRDMINAGLVNYADILVNQGIEKVVQMLNKDLGNLKNFNDVASIKAGIRFLNDKQKVTNADFLLQKSHEFGSVKKWLYSDAVTKDVIEKMKTSGFDTDFYIASGRIVDYKKADGHYSDDWIGTFKSIVVKVLGSKKNGTLPNVSIPNVSPKKFYKKIAVDYQSSLGGNKDSAKKVLKTIKLAMLKNFSKKKIPQSVMELLGDIEMLGKVLDYGGTVTFRGAKVVAKVWQRKVPNDLYDSEILRCCIFLPNGEQKDEIPIFMMDPQTTLVQFYVQGINEPVAAATFYAGLSDGTPALLMDTWEAGSLAYAALSYAKMQNFALETMIKFAKKSGAKKLLIFADAEYGRPEEFCNYLRGQGLKNQKVNFEIVDNEDSVLKTYSKGKTHHYTDAFPLKPIKGNIDAFVFDA